MFFQKRQALFSCATHIKACFFVSFTLSGVTKGGEGGARFGCHHYEMTPFYDDNSSNSLLKTFLNVVASVNVSFMRPKTQNRSFRSHNFFLLCNYRPHSIAIIDRIVCKKLAMWKLLSFYRCFYL